MKEQTCPYVVSTQEGTMYCELAEKPPLGIKPRWLMDEERQLELMGAIRRSLDSGKDPDSAWFEELDEINKRIMDRMIEKMEENRERTGLVEVITQINEANPKWSRSNARCALRSVADWLENQPLGAHSLARDFIVSLIRREAIK